MKLAVHVAASLLVIPLVGCQLGSNTLEGSYAFDPYASQMLTDRGLWNLLDLKGLNDFKLQFGRDHSFKFTTLGMPDVQGTYTYDGRRVNVILTTPGGFLDVMNETATRHVHQGTPFQLACYQNGAELRLVHFTRSLGHRAQVFVFKRK